MAKCSWCGGEILEPVCVRMPADPNEITYLIYDIMKEKRYCSTKCLQKHIRGVLCDLMEENHSIKSYGGISR